MQKNKIRNYTIGGILALTMIGGGIAAGVSAADASSSIVVATIQVSNHPDTTSPSGSGTACTSSPGGPVWARDSYTSQLTAVSTGSGTWRVTLQDTGSFAGFADPATCNAMASHGDLLGMYTVTVNSTHNPSPANLAASYTGNVSSTTMVQDFFGDPSATVNGGDYFFSYQDGEYVQTTSSIYGDVSGQAPVKVPSVAGLSANAAITKVKAAGFAAITSPVRNPAFTYVATGTNPSGNAPKGSLVVIYIKRT